MTPALVAFLVIITPVADRGDHVAETKACVEFYIHKMPAHAVVDRCTFVVPPPPALPPKED